MNIDKEQMENLLDWLTSLTLQKQHCELYDFESLFN